MCGGELYQRSDDSEDTVRTRLEVYHRETEPIIDYYKQQDLVVTISALGTVDEVTERAMEALRAGSDAAVGVGQLRTAYGRGAPRAPRPYR